MRWPEVQATYPNQWLVIEAMEAHTQGNRRILDHITVVEVCPDSVIAMQTYRRLHQRYPLREFYFVHTSRASLDIEERRWVGIRRSNETLMVFRLSKPCKTHLRLEPLF